jgi:hypothetical protein
MSEINKEYKIPASYIETGFGATAFEDGNELDFQKASPDLKPYADLARSAAINSIVESQVAPEDILERAELLSPLGRIALFSKEMIDMRKKAAGADEAAINYQPLQSAAPRTQNGYQLTD